MIQPCKTSKYPKYFISCTEWTDAIYVKLDKNGAKYFTSDNRSGNTFGEEMINMFVKSGEWKEVSAAELALII